MYVKDIVSISVWVLIIFTWCEGGQSFTEKIAVFTRAFSLEDHQEARLHPHESTVDCQQKLKERNDLLYGQWTASDSVLYYILVQQ